MDSRKDILWRVYMVYFLICLLGLAVFSRILWIQFSEGDVLREKAKNQITDVREIEAIRGNILANDGSLLATSVPIYEVRMDVNTEALTDKIFDEEAPKLADSLARLFGDRSATYYLKRLQSARKKGNRYLLIRRNVKYAELQKLKTFPLFRLGQYKGGFIYIQMNKRTRPFQLLAARTIGYYRGDDKLAVGLEGAYRDELSGVSGKRLMRRISDGVWMPVNDDNVEDPKDGNDLITTIDINIQDVAEKALMDQLIKQDASHGCVVLMEVKTGFVKAIANLSKNKNGAGYYENYNYAIGDGSEPGSTFKLASIMVALEDGFIKLQDSVDVENGCTRYYDRRICDVHREKGKISIEKSFVESSNVGISKVIWNYYKERQQQFVDGLYKLNLHKPLGIDIKGEATPYIKKTDDPQWWGTTLPWMSIGYEVELTPLQILNFYNAVANHGKMVKPQFVKEIRSKGKVVKIMEPVVLNNAICSEATIKKVQSMLEKVVEEGTAKNLRNPNFKIAGKTGTRQKLVTGKYSNKSHVASFVGYFPAEDPKYSCIVVINEPSKDVYYGGAVAGPVFKEIADKVYASDLDIHDPANLKPVLAEAPYSKNGSREELMTVMKQLNMPVNVDDPETDWVIASAKDSTVQLLTRKIEDDLKSGVIPKLNGMAAKDVIYLLENNGIRVKIRGKGVVTGQSVSPGSRLEHHYEITLDLG